MKTKNRRARLLALLLPFLVFLGGCKSEATLDFSDADNASFVFEFDTEKGSNSANATRCAALKPSIDAQKRLLGEGTVSPLPGSVGLGCRIKLKLPPSSKALLYTKIGNKVKVSIPVAFWSSFNSSFTSGSGLTQSDLESANFSLKIKMPGEVTNASNGGKISGTEVTWTSYKTVSQGISAESDPAGSPTTRSTKKSPTETSTGWGGSTASEESDDSDDGGFPIWAWVAIAVGGLVLVGLVVFLAVRKKGGDDNFNPYGGGYPGPPTPGSTPPGYPQYGYSGPSAQPQSPAQQPPQNFPTQTYGQPPANYGQRPDAYGQPNAAQGQGPQSPGNYTPGFPQQ